MNPIAELLESEEVLLLDGAMGTMLINLGIKAGEAPELWNVEHADRIRSVHRAYIAAGARIVLTNSFGGTGIRLARHGLEDRTAELNRAAAANARAEAGSAPHKVLVAGSMGPTGELMKPMGPLTPEKARAAFAEQAAALAEGGADLLWVETMSDLEELKAAVEGARQAADLPVVATMSFDTRGRTMMGVTPVQAAETLRALDVAALGANCGKGPDELLQSISNMHAHAPTVVLVAKANAGLPHMVDGELVYDGTPALMADYALKARREGAQLIGACCGSTPAHIRAMAEALGAVVPADL